MFGKLTLEAFKHDPIEQGAGWSMLFAALAIIGYITYTKKWSWIWKEWITSLDPKRIGAMYIIVGLVMLIKGFVDALMMRAQQAMSSGASYGYLTEDHFQQVFTAHGTTMIFFVAMAVVFGLMNLVVPLQIGARDVAFPFLNALSFWLFAAGAVFINLSLVVGKFSATGWLAYPPLSGIDYNPGEGVDYWIWTLQIAGVGSLLSGINFLVTILKMRCHGMTMMRMPIFVWAALCTLVLIVFAFPVLTATLALLTLDRLMGMHFFTAGFGGNPMLYINLIWAWGHPEVYILILPAFGTFSSVVSTFSQKRLFGYHSMVWAIVAITFLSFIVWVHHFFTMGAGPSVNAFFGIMTMLIAIPTGVKIFNWLFTMYQGRVYFTTPILWFLGFVVIFTIGGMAGMLLSIPAVDFQVHNSLFLIAHFHSVIIGGALFGFFAAYAFWFPKVFGFTLNERLGRYAFWCWMGGFLLAFMPLYALGLNGATRRLSHYSDAGGWQHYFIIASIGALLILVGVGFQTLQLIVSIRDRNKNRDTTGDPWHGRTLEWATSSPPPVYNFAIIPEIEEEEHFWTSKQADSPEMIKPVYHDIHMPKNTPMPMLIGACGFIFCFAMIWQIWWLSIVGLIGMIVLLIIRLSDDDIEYTIPASEVEKIETTTLQRKQYVWQNL